MNLPEFKNFLLFAFAVILIGCKINPATNGMVLAENAINEQQASVIFEKSKIYPNETQISMAFVDSLNPRFYGTIRKNDTISHIENRNRTFEIGSITKVFTSTLLANAVIENKIDLDENIADHLDIKLKNDVEITFEQLANHTSGLPRMPSNLDAPNTYRETSLRFYDESKLRHYLTHELKVDSKPEEKSEYSNLGASLLAYTLSIIDSKPYEELLQQKIFEKYKMTRFTSKLDKKEGYLVVGLDPRGNEERNLELSALAGGGGILSTVEDLSKFINAHFDSSNLELSLTRKKTFKIDNESNRGLSWRIVRNENGQNLYYHSGKTKGYTSFLALNIEAKKGLAILSNVSGQNDKSNNIIELGFALMNTLTGNN